MTEGRPPKQWAGQGAYEDKLSLHFSVPQIQTRKRASSWPEGSVCPSPQPTPWPCLPLLPVLPALGVPSGAAGSHVAAGNVPPLGFSLPFSAGSLLNFPELLAQTLPLPEGQFQLCSTNELIYFGEIGAARRRLCNPSLPHQSDRLLNTLPSFSPIYRQEHSSPLCLHHTSSPPSLLTFPMAPWSAGRWLLPSSMYDSPTQLVPALPVPAELHRGRGLPDASMPSPPASQLYPHAFSPEPPCKSALGQRLMMYCVLENAGDRRGCKCSSIFFWKNSK